MLNLAPYRYRNVLATDQGPIARIELGEIQVPEGRRAVANAFLRDDLCPAKHVNHVFSPANGTGVDPSPMVARFKAISEAMERWAHLEVMHSERRKDFGFDVDPSSTGMAAFPGLFAKQARASALMEASERFNLLNWWEGRLAGHATVSRWDGILAVALRSEAPGVTVILYRRGPNKYFAYGHASGWDFDSACDGAVLEMRRHEQVVQHWLEKHPGSDWTRLPADAHVLERRSLYFSTLPGHLRFLERLCAQPALPPPRPRMVFDGVIPGPWSRYADVWRVAYEPPSLRFISSEVEYFFL